jgi:hypothetical protein
MAMAMLRCKARCQHPQHERGAGDVALVHLVAHGEAARNQRIELDPAQPAQRISQRNREIVAQPGKARQHLGVVTAKAHHLAEAFVDGAERAIAVGAVLDHEERHAARGDSGHRADRAEVMVRGELDAARRRKRLGRAEVCGPALEHERAADRAA